nr:MAG TPA: hypothetical protein [Caudoviricetes sp.]
MNKENYPTWHIPLNIVKELKAIGFDKISVISYSAGTGITAIRKELYSWEQVFEWFRAKGYYGNLEATNKGTSAYIFTPEEDFGSCWKFQYSNYEEARETLLLKLIAIYKAANQ